MCVIVPIERIDSWYAQSNVSLKIPERRIMVSSVSAASLLCTPFLNEWFFPDIKDAVGSKELRARGGDIEKKDALKSIFGF